MKKYLTLFNLLIVLQVISLVSCSSENSLPKTIKGENYTKVYQRLDFQTYVITLYEYRMEDGCQYIGNLDSHGRANCLTHKGLCDNPKHKQ